MCNKPLVQFNKEENRFICGTCGWGLGLLIYQDRKNNSELRWWRHDRQEVHVKALA